MKKRILLVTNLALIPNPPLWYIYNLLKDKYEVSISGYDPPENAPTNVQYDSHARRYIKFRKIIYLRAVFKFYNAGLKYFIRRKQITPQIADEMIRLYFFRKYFSAKNKKFDFIVNIDAEACVVSSGWLKKNKIPSCYFVYELFADQLIDLLPAHRAELIKTERLAVTQSNFLLTNNETANHLNREYQSNILCCPFTVCPEKAFKEISVNDPLRFYYHGYFFGNRGLEECILALKQTREAQLFFRGTGPLKERMLELIKENGLNDRVFFPGMVATEDLPAAGISFDIGLTLVRMNVKNHLFASGFKTFDNISAGLALIIPASAPLQALQKNYRVGLVYEDATVENLASLFVFCENNPEAVLGFKKNVRSAYDIEYNPGVQRTRLIEHIENCLN